MIGTGPGLGPGLGIVRVVVVLVCLIDRNQTSSSLLLGLRRAGFRPCVFYVLVLLPGGGGKGTAAKGGVWWRMGTSSALGVSGRERGKQCVDPLQVIFWWHNVLI